MNKNKISKIFKIICVIILLVVLISWVKKIFFPKFFYYNSSFLKVYSIDSTYSYTKTGIYARSWKCKSSKPETGWIFWNIWMSDYCDAQMVKVNANKWTFVSLGYGYWKDKNSIYYNGILIEWIDRESFIVTGDKSRYDDESKGNFLYDAQDKNYFYYNWKRIKEKKDSQ